MPFARITRYALLLAPLVVCLARLHAQGAASPAPALQDANRCLGIVRASSKRRQRNERSQRTESPVAQASVGSYSS
jgi:hypothetical protein